MCYNIIIFVVKSYLIVLCCNFYCDVNATPIFYGNYPCRHVCPRTYAPVCAGPLTIISGSVDNNISTFYNLCLLEKYNCEHLTNWFVKYNGLCYANTPFTVQSG